MAGKGHRMYQNPALAGLKTHARTPRSATFSFTWRSRQRHRISLSWAHLEGFVRQMAHLVPVSGGYKWQLSNHVEAICPDFARTTKVNWRSWRADIGSSAVGRKTFPKRRIMPGKSRITLYAAIKDSGEQTISLFVITAWKSKLFIVVIVQLIFF